MSIKITEKILSIPPYISTLWSRIAAIHVKENVLCIALMNGETVHIPNLAADTLESIFHHHALYLEKDHLTSSENIETSKLRNGKDLGEPAIQFAFGTSMESLGSMMQHNPNQANAPDLPPEILQKIGAIAKLIAPSDEQLITPAAEPNCNCFQCQIARVLKPAGTHEDHVEPIVTHEELQFQQWTITPAGDQLYSVVNRLDEHEKYHVYLGEPVGCTCGHAGCEHILAVLKS